MKVLNPVKQLEILKESYVSANMVYELYPAGMNWARNLVNEIREDLEKRGIPLMTGKEKYVPIKEVLKRYPINQKSLEEYVQMQNKNASPVEKESV